MQRIPDATIERIKDATDIVEIVSDHVQLTKRGRNFFGVCPFHSEKTASFSVNPELQIYRCFGCGEGGNAFKFIQKIDGVSFVEAVSFLAQRSGIPLMLERNTEAAESNDELFRANEIASKYFQHMLLSDELGRPALQYLEGRGLSRETIEDLTIGFAPDSWDGLLGVLNRRGIPPPVSERAGLSVKRQKGSGCYDRFRGRIAFPIANATGRVVGFGARALADDQEPKYLNSPETPIYRKSLILYGLSRSRGAIRERELALVVEGYMDVARLVQHGISNVVATSGTALTAEQCRLLSRYSRRVVLVFDGDSAGSTAAERGIEFLLGADLEARVVCLPEGHDPDSLVRDEGAERLNTLVDSSLSVLDFYLDRLAARFDLRTVEGKAQVVVHLKPVIGRINDAVRRDLMLREVASRLGVDERAIRAELQRETRESKSPGSASASLPVAAELPSIEQQFLGLLLKYPRFIAPSGTLIEPQDLLDPRARAICTHLFDKHKSTDALDPSLLVEEFDDENLVNAVTACAVEEFDEEQVDEFWSDTVQRFKSDAITRRMESLKQELAAASKKGNERLVEELAGDLEELVKERASNSVERAP
jgi:DNA primase